MSPAASQPDRSAIGRAGAWLGEVRWPHLLIAAIVLMLPLMIFGERTNDSWSLDQLWTIQFSEQLAHNPYPRWLDRSFDGLGAPVFYFYPPLAFYLTAAIHYLTFGGLTPFREVLAAATLALFVSGLTMRMWLVEVGGRPWMALLYMIAPYHLAEMFNRGALAEFCAYALLPLVMIGLRRALGGRGVLLLAVSYAGLVLTHMPTALLASVLLIAPFALWNGGALSWPAWTRAAVGVGLGLGLAAIYLLPALTLPMNVELMTRAGLRVADSYFWNWRLNNLLIPVMILVMLLSVLLATRSFWSIMSILLSAVAIGLLPLLLAPVLNRVQFGWRVLPLAELCLVTSLALRPKIPSPVLGLAYLIVIVALAADPPAHTDLRGFGEATEYMPAGALRTTVNGGDLPKEEILRLPPVSTKYGIVTLRKFNFPSWRSCRPIEGLLVNYPVGCEARIVATPSERLGAAISASALAIVAALAWRGRRRRRRPALLEA